MFEAMQLEPKYIRGSDGEYKGSEPRIDTAKLFDNKEHQKTKECPEPDEFLSRAIFLSRIATELIARFPNRAAPLRQLRALRVA